MPKITKNPTETYTLDTTIEDSKGLRWLPVSDLRSSEEIEDRKIEIRGEAEPGSTITFTTRAHRH